MWPFRTIRNLRLEIEQANNANQTLRGVLSRRDEAIGILEHQLKHARAEVVDAENLRHQLVGARTECDHLQIAVNSSMEVRKALAAERDEAVLRARSMDATLGSVRRLAGEYRDQLRGALVRDPKTGRMARWVDPKSSLGVVRSLEGAK